MTIQKLKVAITIFTFLLILSLLIARFFYIEADFPRGLTWEGAPYADEGWLAYNAVSYILTGKWYVEGSFNEILLAPVFVLVQAVSFKIWGISLMAARTTIILFYSLSILLTYLLVRKYAQHWAALSVALLLAVNFILFGYSRLATSVIPEMSLGLLSVFIALYFPMQRYFIVGGIAAVVFVLALLTKPTIIQLLPTLIYAVYVQRQSFKTRIVSCVWVSGLILVLYLLYRMVINTLYPDEYAYFTSAIFTSRFTFDPVFVLTNIARAIWNGAFLDSIMYPITITMLFFPIWLGISKSYRENPLVGACLVWILSYVGLLSFCRYQPPRYYIALIVPVTILFGLLVVAVYQALRPSRWSYLPIIAFMLVVLTNLVRMALYFQTPVYSFRSMTQHIYQQVIQDQEQHALLLGDVANSVSLATRLPSISDDMGTRDVRWKISHYHPTHYVSLGIKSDILAILEEFYHVEQVRVYDVFENYYAGKQVHFYRLTSK